MRFIMKQIALILSLSVISAVLVAQNKKLDSLYQVLQNYPREDTNRVMTLTRICYYEYTSTPEKCRKHAEEARRIAEKIAYAKGIGLSLRYISLYYWVTGDYDKAADFAFQMLRVFEGLGDEQGLAKAYTLIGLIHEEWGNFDKSKEYHLQSLALNRKANRLYDMAYNYNSLGTLHKSYGKNDEAYTYYLKSLELRKQIKDEDGMSQSYVNLGGFAHDRKEYDRELEYYTLALPIAKKLGNINRLSLISQALGKIYMVKGQFENADKLLQDALIMARTLGNKKVQGAIYRSLLTMEKERGDYEKALAYSMKEMAVQDSLFTEEKTRQMAEMEASYETGKKEQAIELLARDNKIRALWQNIFGGGLTIMLLSGFLYYRVQRSNDKKNRELLEVQESVNKKLTEVDKMKSHFFASVSHEFRTPLTLIKGPIEQLLEHPEQALTLDKAQMIHRNSNRLLQLVNQLLDLSKLDAGNLRMEISGGDIYKFLRIISSSFDSYAQQHGIKYMVQFDGLSLLASFDQDKLEKIAYNLLSNAFKFTPGQGSVVFMCRHAEQKLIMEVSDNGRGIDPRHLPHIFDRFYQATDHHAAYEGTGIGLSLVKELVSLMEGSIDVASEPGKRTTFTVTLPIVPLESGIGENPTVSSLGKTYHGNKPDTSPVETNADEKETILVIEDNADMRGFIREQLTREYRIIEAVQGIEGFALACREIPDLIISDIMMPEMNGIALCEAIKKDERTSHIPMIMLTARDGRESKIEGLETGADDYLIKPFDSHELSARIRNLIAQRQQLRKKYSQQIVLQPKNITISSVDNLFLEKVESTIEKYLSQARFGVPQLQDALSMSKTQFHRKMKALTDQAPGEFLRNYRLKRAAQLLEQQGGNVTEIAFAVGFGSLSYFTRSFKDLFGKSPSEYSQLQKEAR
jgi:signal transduction histidine kinase/DNA-binding response OmpR family regulator